MHIGINAQLLSFSESYRNGGVSRYIRSLLVELAKQPGEHLYTIFVNGRAVKEQMEATAQHSQITYVPMSWPESRPAARVVWEQFTLPSLLRQKHIDVLHAPVNVLPQWLPRTCAGVITLHDLAFLRFPHVLARSKRLYHRTFTIRSLRHATMLVTDSESTKQDAIELVGIPAERIQTVYPCIDSRFADVSGIEEKEVETFRLKQGLSQGFLLYLGTLEPRKNSSTLIEAYALLRQKYAVQEKLVLAGGKGWFYEPIFEKVRQLQLESEVLFPGYVSDAEQALWYRAASAFAYPSLYEGFGLPVAEALACGTPVVTSNISSLPEAGADIALCVDPHDVEVMAQALYKALTDQVYRKHCRAMATSVTQRFSASAMVEQMRTVYKQAALLHDSQKGTRIAASVR